MNRFIMANAQQCIGCRACEVACVMAHNGEQHALSEADAIAASEQEVRDILLSEAQKYHKEVQFDGLGSVLIRVNQSRGPKVMVCAHMDEVGFMVRSEIGRASCRERV